MVKFHVKQKAELSSFPVEQEAKLRFLCRAGGRIIKVPLEQEAELSRFL